MPENKISLRDAFAQQIIAAAEKDERIVAIDCDVKTHSRLDRFENLFPDRFVQAGASEQHALSLAAGYARAGKRPIVASFAAFIGSRGFEQARNSVGLQKLPVLIVGSHAGFAAGEDGASHQAFDDVGLFRLIPGFEVHAPGDAFDVAHCLDVFLNGTAPAYMRYGRVSLSSLTKENTPRPEIRKISGDGSIAIVATGEVSHEVASCLNEIADRENFSLFHVGRVEPLPELPSSVLRAATVVTVEDHYRTGGLFSAMSERFADIGVTTEIIPLNVARRFGETGTDTSVRQIMGLSYDRIARRLSEISCQHPSVTSAKAVMK